MYIDYIFPPTYYAPFGYFECQSSDTVVKQNNQFVDTIRVNNRPQENVKRQKTYLYSVCLMSIDKHIYCSLIIKENVIYWWQLTIFKSNSNHYMSVFKLEKLTCWMAKVKYIFWVLFVRIDLVVCWKCNWSTRFTKH